MSKPLDIEAELQNAEATLASFRSGVPEPAWDGAGDTLETLINVLKRLKESERLKDFFEGELLSIAVELDCMLSSRPIPDEAAKMKARAVNAERKLESLKKAARRMLASHSSETVQLVLAEIEK